MRNTVHGQTEICPRCKASFECNAGNIVNCHCSRISLCKAAMAFIKDNYSDCLCANCLKALNAELQGVKAVQDK